MNESMDKTEQNNDNNKNEEQTTRKRFCHVS